MRFRILAAAHPAERGGQRGDTTERERPLSNQDSNFARPFTISVVGLLIMSLALLVLVRYISAQTRQAVMEQRGGAQSQILSRIAPIGRVGLPTEEAPAAAQPAAQAAAQPAPESLSGPQVYNSACLACHGAGIGGAPKIGDPDVWAPRLAQGQSVLADHVINGYQGKAGYMPPKGGRIDLSDEEILAALDYMVEQSGG
jgi:cytochrome c5